MKGDGEPDLQETVRWDGGVGWIAYPEELMQRASVALAEDGDVWVVDPVDAPGLDELLETYGEVAGVVVCFDRHARDADVLARRHGVSVYLPAWISGVQSKIDAPIERFEGRVPDTEIELRPVRNSRIPPWREAALYRQRDGTLVVPESVGAAPYFLTDGEQLGVHPMLRPVPPRGALGSFRPKRVLPGHGPSVEGGAEAALADALAGSRRRMPSLYLRTVKMLLS